MKLLKRVRLVWEFRAEHRHGFLQIVGRLTRAADCASFSSMSTVAEIKDAVHKRCPPERAELEALLWPG